MNTILKVHALFFLLLVSDSYGQDYFEGQIEYQIEYEALNPSITSEYLATELGNSFTAFVKEDRYAMVYHATGDLGWMKIIVRLDEGYSYTEFEKIDTISKTKFGEKKHALLKFKRNTAHAKEILGEVCESITIHYEPKDDTAFFQTFRGTYYFNPTYKLNSQLYERYTDGFWNLFVKESKSISIRNETEFYPLFKSVQEAISIEKKEISYTIFEPNASKIVLEQK